MQIHVLTQNISGQYDPFVKKYPCSVEYFSAYATWRSSAFARHRAYVRALKANNVTPIMGKFKEKIRSCHKCGNRWLDHEEKETDVNIALHLLHDAFQDKFDRALLISGDSDLAPAVRTVLSGHPKKTIRVLAPPGRSYSWDLVHATGGIKNAKKIMEVHLVQSLLPEVLYLREGTEIIRPAEYDPHKPI